MPTRTRTSPNRWPGERPYIPHPSWSGDAAAQLARPLDAADFWNRLGL
jgi:hypothetical protein